MKLEASLNEINKIATIHWLTHAWACASVERCKCDSFQIPWLCAVAMCWLTPYWERSSGSFCGENIPGKWSLFPTGKWPIVVSSYRLPLIILVFIIFLSSSVAFFPLISHQLTPSFLAASQLFKRSGHRITHSKQVGFLCKNQTTGLVYWLELGIRSSVHLFQKTVKVFLFFF